MERTHAPDPARHQPGVLRPGTLLGRIPGTSIVRLGCPRIYRIPESWRRDHGDTFAWSAPVRDKVRTDHNDALVSPHRMTQLTTEAEGIQSGCLPSTPSRASPSEFWLDVSLWNGPRLVVPMLLEGLLHLTEELVDIERFGEDGNPILMQPVLMRAEVEERCRTYDHGNVPE